MAGRHIWRGNYRGFRGKRQKNINVPHETRKQNVTEDPEVRSPFQAWKIYFPDELYDDDNDIAKHIHLVLKHLTRTINIQQSKARVESRGSLGLDTKELLADVEFSTGWPTFIADAKSRPVEVLSTCGLAMHQLMTQEAEREWRAEVDDESPAPPVPFVHARLVGIEPLLPLKNLKTNCYGKLVAIRGTVVRTSDISLVCTRMAFKCCVCSQIEVKELSDGIYDLPTCCANDECRGRTFLPECRSRLTETIDLQTIKIQEIDDEKETGRIPRTVECELTRDLIDSCVPGDVVIVNGIVKKRSEADGKGLSSGTYTLFVDAVSVVGQRDRAAAVGLSVRDLYAIKRIQAEKNLFRLIVASLCPAIYGHDVVKAGLVLALFGGTSKHEEDKDCIPIRGDLHVLVVGDPGLGKSQLLAACADVAPRGVSVCGNATTAVGLTATVCRGASGSDYSLEAGALALADGGACCIDEFDKMPGAQRDALLEAMEQQSISIAKAGIVCSLAARASILAAANPVGGHYDTAKSVADNLRLGGAILSRFDLVFILRDRADEAGDRTLADHVMAIHRSGRKKIRRENEEDEEEDREPSCTLRNRLQFRSGENVDRIPHQLLRKYVAYAKTYVRCKLTSGAAKIIQEHYLKMRAQAREDHSIPVTTRQMESLVRLAQARAKVELREDVTEDDAQDAIEIVKCSMLGHDGTGALLDDCATTSSGTSGRRSTSKYKVFVAALDGYMKRMEKSTLTEQEMRAATQGLDMSTVDFTNMIDVLNAKNYLLKTGAKTYKLIN